MHKQGSGGGSSVAAEGRKQQAVRGRLSFWEGRSQQEHFAWDLCLEGMEETLAPSHQKRKGQARVNRKLWVAVAIFYPKL